MRPRNKVPLSGFADHLVSESVYLDDPEGNGIEVYADRAPEPGNGSTASVTMATDQLDIDGLLALTDTRTTNYAKAPDGLAHRPHAPSRRRHRAGGTLLSRRHRSRPDPQAQRRRVPVVGALSPSPRHQRLAQRTARARATTRPRGLAWFSLEIATAEILHAQTQRLRQAGAPAAAIADGIETADPWGTKVRLIKV